MSAVSICSLSISLSFPRDSHNKLYLYILFLRLLCCYSVLLFILKWSYYNGFVVSILFDGRIRASTFPHFCYAFPSIISLFIHRLIILPLPLSSPLHIFFHSCYPLLLFSPPFIFSYPLLCPSFTPPTSRPFLHSFSFTIFSIHVFFSIHFLLSLSSFLPLISRPFLHFSSLALSSPLFLSSLRTIFFSLQDYAAAERGSEFGTGV